MTLASKNKSDKKKYLKSSSALHRVIGGHLENGNDNEIPDTTIVRYASNKDFPPVYHPTMDYEEYFNKRVRYATLKFILKH